MSRSGYIEYEPDSQEEQWAQIRWRGAVKSAIRGKRGQQLLKELRIGLDALPEKKLIAGELEKDGCFCALGVVGNARGLDMEGINPECSEIVSERFDIAEALAREIVYINDEPIFYDDDSDEKRFRRVSAWVDQHIIGE